MKKLLLLKGVAVMLLLFLSQDLFAQQRISAQLNENHTIMLYTGFDDAPSYIADISEMGWANAKTATEALQKWDKEKVQLGLNFDKKEVTITLLKSSSQADWKFADWFSYLLDPKSK